MKLPVVDTGTLSDAGALERAWSTWSGTVACDHAEAALRPDLHLAHGAPVDPTDFLNEHTYVGDIQPLGCHFLSDIKFAGLLYPFLDAELIDDGSHLSMVSAHWLSRVPAHRPGLREGGPSAVLVDPVLPVAGPGHQTYGHWIIDFLPRLAVARKVLGERFRELKFLILSDTPHWALELMDIFFGIREADCIRFHAGIDEYFCRRVCYPTFAHSYPFLLHSFIHEFYRTFAPPAPPHRRLCVRRRTVNSDMRLFERRASFEAQAVIEGFELVDPQTLGIMEQAALFSSASVIIGEYGSALHNSVFSPQSAILGVLNAPGVEQTRLCAAFHQPIVYMPSSNKSGAWTLTDDQLVSFFATVEKLELSRRPASPRSDLAAEIVPPAQHDASSYAADLHGTFRATSIYGTVLAIDHTTRELLHTSTLRPERPPAVIYLPRGSPLAFILFDNPQFVSISARYSARLGPIIVVRRRFLQDMTFAFSDPHELTYLIAHDQIAPDGAGMAAFFGFDVAEWQRFRLHRLLRADLAQPIQRQIALIETVLATPPTQLVNLLRQSTLEDQPIIASLLTGALNGSDAELLAAHLLDDAARVNDLAAMMPTDPWATLGLPALQMFLKRRRIDAALPRPPGPPHEARSRQPASVTYLGPERDRLASDGANGGFASFVHHCAVAGRRVVAPVKDVCVVAAARDEGLYLLDWIAYHYAVGVDRAIIYSNGNTDGSDTLLRALAAAGEISLIENVVGGGCRPSSKAYGHALGLAPEVLDYRWCATIDVDEMIGFDREQFGSIRAFLEWQELRPVDVIALNWLMFGSNGRLRWSNEPVSYRFRDRHLDGHIKSIFRPRKFHHAMRHFPRTDGASTIICRDAVGQPHPCIVGQSPAPRDGPAWIAHYSFRSLEEFIWKWTRGRRDEPLGEAPAAITVPEDHMAGFVRQYRELALTNDDRMTACAEPMAQELQRLMGLPGVADALAAIHRHYRRRSGMLVEMIRQLRPAASPQAAIFYDLLLEKELQDL